MTSTPFPASMQSSGPVETSPFDIPLAELLARGGGGKREVIEAVNASGDDELLAFGLRAYRLNFLSLFGEIWPRERINAAARNALISKLFGGWEYHHHYLPGLTGTADTAQVCDVPIALVKELLSRGRGLILMTFHLGQMRYLASDVAHAGIPICVPLATDASHDYETARAANPAASLWSTFHMVNVEDPRGAFALARSLRKGGCVFSTIDGNTGLDGPRGSSRRTDVRLIGAEARVKTGLFDMAARFGAPILVMIAHTQGGVRRCRTGPLIDPGGVLSSGAKVEFVSSAVQDAYSFFGEALLGHADEWCGGDLFHQWKLPAQAAQRDIRIAERKVEEALCSGGGLAMNWRRIVPLDGGGELVWSDALSNRCYKMPDDMVEMARHLENDLAGVDLNWLRKHGDLTVSRMKALLCQLVSRQAIEVVDSANGDVPDLKVIPSFQEIARPSDARDDQYG